MTFRKSILAVATFVALGASVSTLPMVAQAAVSFTVITNLDTPSTTCGTAAHTGTLRDCIAAANAAGGTNVITFAPSVVAPIVLSAGQLSINAQTLTIVGNGQTTTIVDGNAASRVFEVTSGSAVVTMTDFTIRNGAFQNPSGFDGGAGIKNQGNLTLDRMTVSGNVASAAPGAASTSGGILHAGSSPVTIRNSTIKDNSSTSDSDAAGGGIQVCCAGAPDVVISDTTFSNNVATDTGTGLLRSSP